MLRFIVAGSILAAASCCAVAEAASSARRVVAVLYFDNNTAQGELDVLKKGVADMLVTDLSSVPGLQVVERRRLESLLDELRLQRTKYFDPKTAVKIGRGLGARYAVTGAFAAVDPKLRIDIRMVEIATGEVLVADKVVGDKTSFFELQAELVDKFVRGLQMKAPPPSRRRRVPDIDTLLEYSKSVDLADQGRLADAAERMKKLVRRQPTFILARAKQAEFRKRLREAQDRRQDAISSSARSFEEQVRDYLKSHTLDLTDQKAAKTYLAHRFAFGGLLMTALRPHLATKSIFYVLKDHEEAAYRLLRAIHAHQERLIDEIDQYTKTFTRRRPDGVPYLDRRAELPKRLRQAAKTARFDDAFYVDAVEQRRRLGELLLLGEVFDGERYAAVGPVLGSIDGELEARGFEVYEEAYRLAKEELKLDPRRERAVINTLASHADAFILRDRVDEAIAKLQMVLDQFPTNNSYDRIEKRIQVELGMKFNHNRSNYAGFVEGLKTCVDMKLRKGIAITMSAQILRFGRPGIFAVIERVEKACKDKPEAKRLKRFWPYLYMRGALYGGTRGDCEVFETFVEKYLDAGGSRRDLKGYRKNYAKTCNKPKANDAEPG